LTREQARRFYDDFGAKQDRQAFYEDRALALLVAHSGLASAAAVVELGCGTGRFAERLLDEVLPTSAQYSGFDLSGTMVNLARERLARFGGRARVEQTDGERGLPVADGSASRFVSNYVLDLLPPGETRRVLDDAHRILVPDGLMCVVSIAPGATLLSKIVMGAWSAVHAVSPRTVGGCRPIRLRDALSADYWEIVHDEAVVSWGITSNALVARRMPA
jgi:ubiquinone/menaquinone biosynthesis C-methylase UbiE